MQPNRNALENTRWKKSGNISILLSPQMGLSEAFCPLSCLFAG